MLIIVECRFQLGGNVGVVVNQSPLALLQLKNIGGAWRSVRLEAVTSLLLILVPKFRTACESSGQACSYLSEVQVTNICSNSSIIDRLAP